MATDAGDENGDSDYDPADAFAAVSNETRVEIIRAFVEEQRRLGREHDEPLPPEDLRPVLSFSELQEAAGIRDSGQFNYHLDQLVGRYVQRAPEADEEGYTLTWAGIEVAGSILAGGYGDVEVDRQEIARTCPSCGSALEATYTMGFFFLFCSNTDDLVLAAGLPAGVFEGRSLEEAADVARQVQRRIHDAVTDGYCPVCYGHVGMRVGRATTEDLLTESEHALRGQCDRCANVFMAPVTAGAIRHPAVVAFYHEHDIDVRETFDESFEPLGENEPVSLVSEDPLRLAVTFEVEDDALRAVVDETGTVVETERV